MAADQNRKSMAAAVQEVEGDDYEQQDASPSDNKIAKRRKQGVAESGNEVVKTSEVRKKRTKQDGPIGASSKRSKLVEDDGFGAGPYDCVLHSERG